MWIFLLPPNTMDMIQLVIIHAAPPRLAVLSGHEPLSTGSKRHKSEIIAMIPSCQTIEQPIGDVAIPIPAAVVEDNKPSVPIFSKRDGADVTRLGVNRVTKAVWCDPFSFAIAELDVVPVICRERDIGRCR